MLQIGFNRYKQKMLHIPFPELLLSYHLRKQNIILTFFMYLIFLQILPFWFIIVIYVTPVTIFYTSPVKTDKMEKIVSTDTLTPSIVNRVGNT